MHTRHTDGPWCQGIEGPDHARILGPNGEGICNVYGIAAADPSQFYANACLIAAAPDLLEALRDVEANLTGRDNFPERVADSLRRIAEVITKATAN